MYVILMILGIGCVIGAVVGGGVKVKSHDTHLEVPLVASRGRQVALAVVGAALLGWGGLLYQQARQQERSSSTS